MLYHASLDKKISDFLEPRTPRTLADGSVKLYLFASSNKLSAYGYAFKTPNMAHFIFGENEGIFVVKDRDLFLQTQTTGRIFTLSPDNFTYFGSEDNPTTEWVSDTPVRVDVAAAELVTLDKAMKQGIHFFSFKSAQAQEVTQQAFTLEEYISLAQAGHLTYENPLLKRQKEPVIKTEATSLFSEFGIV